MGIKMASPARVCVSEVGLLAVQLLTALKGEKEPVVKALKQMLRRRSGS